MDIFKVESKIESNLKQLDFYYDLLNKLQSKITVLVVFYTFIFFYLIELIKYAIDINSTLIDIVFIWFFFGFLISLAISLYLTFEYYKPEDVQFLDVPNIFYNEVLEEYKSEFATATDKTLNAYVNQSYLRQTEIALEKNMILYRKKSELFYKSFKSLLFTLSFYIFLSSFVIYQKRNQNSEIELRNYEEIINYLNKNNMAKEPKVDPKKVIVRQPVAVKQSGGKTDTGATRKAVDVIKKKIDSAKRK